MYEDIHLVLRSSVRSSFTLLLLLLCPLIISETPTVIGASVPTALFVLLAIVGIVVFR